MNKKKSIKKGIILGVASLTVGSQILLAPMNVLADSVQSSDTSSVTKAKALATSIQGRALGTRIVDASNFDEFKAAMQDATVKQINLTGDISFPDAVSQDVRANHSVVIEGNNHTIHMYRQTINGEQDGINTITFQNVNIDATYQVIDWAAYGLVKSSVNGYVVNLDNVTYNGPQIAWLLGGTLNISGNTTINAHYTQEVAEVKNIYFKSGSNVSLQNTEGTGNDIYIANQGNAIIEDNAKVKITTKGIGIYADGTSVIKVGNGSSLDITSKSHGIYAPSAEVTFGKGSSTNLTYYATDVTNNARLYGRTVTLDGTKAFNVTSAPGTPYAIYMSGGSFSIINNSIFDINNQNIANGSPFYGSGTNLSFDNQQVNAFNRGNSTETPDYAWDGLVGTSYLSDINSSRNSSQTSSFVNGFKNQSFHRLASTGVADTTPPDAPTVNTINDKTTEVTGKAEPGSTVTVSAGGKVIGTGTADADGNYAVSIPAQDAGTVVSVNATDEAGNKSDSTDKTVAATSLENPTVNKVGDSDTTITGTATPGAKVTISIPNDNGGTLTYTGTAGTDGKYSIAIGKQEVGTKINVSASKGGLDSGTVTTTVVDNTAPAQPTLNAVSDIDTKVTGTAEAGSTVTIKSGDAVIAKATADADGNYSATIASQKGGSVITVTATDKAGNVSPASSVTVKNTTLSAPTISPVTADQTSVTVTGNPGAKMEITLPDGTSMLKTADASGKATFTISKLTAGSILSATQTGANGIASDAAKVTVSAGQLDAPTIDKYVINSSYVTGTAPSGAKRVALYSNGVLVRYGVVAADGTYSIWGKDALKTVGQTFDVYAVDANGKLSKKASSTVDSGKSLVTTAPTIDEYKLGSTYVTGTVGENTKRIALYVDGQLARYGAVAADGTYKIWGKDFLTKTGQSFEIRPVDANGIEGPAATAKVVSDASLVTTAPTIADYTLGETYITGTVGENTKRIALYVNGQLARYGAVAADGTYKIWGKDTLTTAGQAFEVRPVDQNGAEGPAATAIVKGKSVSTIGAPVINDYKAATSYVTGTVSEGTTRIALYVDGKLVRYGAVATDGTYKIWASDILKTAGQTFEVHPVDANGIEGNSTTSVVK
ncbi:Ig-like domain-containing protein [Listeria aquatica]|uniref:Modifier protein of major autolysin LytC n=1 Tax=Listeria aquatica FSL S10-1188 TaxID=1265818 RepID=W7BAF0_9LIST|nr:Ig-like domain-containing protein [Listeria aquatica]EUJ16898.1 hypothetical protein MAQA_14929 [Listeria aquatica FSL S10-1188]